MVIVFVLLIFTAGQFYLTDALSGRDAALQQLTAQVNQLTDMLALERQTSADLKLNVTQLTGQLAGGDAAARRALDPGDRSSPPRPTRRRRSSTRKAAALAEAQKSVSVDKDQIELQLRQIASLQQDIDALKTGPRRSREQGDGARRAAGSRTTRTSPPRATAARSSKRSSRPPQERTALAQKEIDTRDVRIAQQQNHGRRPQRTQLDEPQGTSSRASPRRSTRRRPRTRTSRSQLADLGRRLNQALASKVEELARYRSEFFGRLREVLGDRPDIRVVGDRFVFQSEVLFDPAAPRSSPRREAAPRPRGRRARRRSPPKIPTDIPWVLQVDGHTDKRPISTPQFPSNWELSTARALSVVRFLVEQGIPADRLVGGGLRRISAGRSRRQPRTPIARTAASSSS